MSNKAKTTDMKEDCKPALGPKLRFPEFRDANGWREGRIGDIAEVLQGYGFPERYQGQTTGDYPFYKVSDISNTLAAGKVFIEESAHCITEDVLKELKAKPIPEGTTIFAKIGEAIRSNRRAITTKSCLIDNNVAGVKRIQGKSTDLFVYFTMETISLIDYSGGVVPSVNKSAIENIAVKFPVIGEQQKIAECLSSMDELIAAQARKLDALKAHKKGLVQQLFPREGETQPRLRFPEFREQWVETQLDNLCSSISSGRDQIDSDGAFDLYGSTSVIGKTRKVSFSGERILVARVGANAGMLTKAKGEFGVTDNTLVVSLKPSTNIDFLFHYMGNININKLIFGSGQPLITGSILKNLPIHVPKDSEQQWIADCLTSLDDLIVAQTRKLEALKTQKKGLMQQLFPSPEEVEA
jgi:type I restriction enzyme S subunit